MELETFATAEALAETAARRWLEDLARHAGPAPYTAALSGGRIAQTFFSAVRQQAAGHERLLQSAHYFWADERCVGPESPESNYRLALEGFLAPAGIPEDRLHRVRGEWGPESAAAQAETALSQLTQSGILDLVLLGLGEDGHIASLFPGHPIEIASERLYVPVYNAPKPPPERVSLTLETIARARNIWVLVSGPGKAAILSHALSGGRVLLGSLARLRNDLKVLTDCEIKMPARP